MTFKEFVASISGPSLESIHDLSGLIAMRDYITAASKVRRRDFTDTELHDVECCMPDYFTIGWHIMALQAGISNNPPEQVLYYLYRAYLEVNTDIQGHLDDITGPDVLDKFLVKINSGDKDYWGSELVDYLHRQQPQSSLVTTDGMVLYRAIEGHVCSVNIRFIGKETVRTDSNIHVSLKDPIFTDRKLAAEEARKQLLEQMDKLNDEL